MKAGSDGRKKALVAMSGGVDSSVAALLLTVLFNLLVLALMAATVYLFVKLYKKR